MRRLSFLTLYFFIGNALSQATEPIYNQSKMNFIYQPNDDKAFSCSFSQENRHANFWRVLCPYYSSTREFSVKIQIRKFERKKKPKTSYEIMYWVVNRLNNENIPEFTGSTIRFYLEEKNWAHSINLSQHVDNGLASLDLKIDLLQ